MNDFDYDIKQKKSLVASARHRVCGSKSKRCSLPSDNLTPAQRKKLNGPVSTIKLGVPMTWSDFEACADKDLQRQYIEDLRTRFNASDADLSRMFGITPGAFSRWLRKKNIPSSGMRGQKKADHKAIWEAFCGGVVGGGDQPEPEVAESDVGKIAYNEPEEGAVVLDKIPVEDVTTEVKDFPAPATVFTSMTFNRIPTEDDLASLRQFYEGKSVSVVIEVGTV